MPALTEALLICLQLAAITVLISTPLAVAFAGLLTRVTLRHVALIDHLVLLPMLLPPVVITWALANDLGIATPTSQWLEWLTGWRATLYPYGIVLAACLIALPLMVRALRPALAMREPMVLAVARTLGATPWRTWCTITWHQTWPAVVSSMVLGLSAAWSAASTLLVVLTASGPAGPAQLKGLGTPASAALTHALNQLRQDLESGQSTAWNLAWASLGAAMLALLLSEWSHQHWRKRAMAQHSAFAK